MDKSTTNLSYYDNQEADGFRYAVSKQMTDARSGMFGEAYTVFKDMVIINQGKCGEFHGFANISRTKQESWNPPYISHLGWYLGSLWHHFQSPKSKISEICVFRH